MLIDSIQGTVRLIDGIQMPGFGLGTFRAADGEEVASAVRTAIELGYRLVDTAAMYANEDGVGRGVATSGIPREQVFVTTKVWPTDLGNVEAALDRSLALLGMEYVDLYLMHWPGPDEKVRAKAWETMLSLQEKGKIRTVGVSNFYVHHLEELRRDTGTQPCVNQVEFHPWQQQKEIREYCGKRGIVVQAWGPMMHGHLSEEPLMGEIGAKYGKSAAQVVLRWDLQSDVATIPKSVAPKRIAANADIFDFELTEQDMAAINALDGKGSFAYNADTFNGVTGK